MKIIRSCSERIKTIKQRFCTHEWELCRKSGMFLCISGEQIYRRCKK